MGKAAAVLAPTHHSPTASLDTILFPLEMVIPLPGTGIITILQVSTPLAFQSVKSLVWRWPFFTVIIN